MPDIKEHLAHVENLIKEGKEIGDFPDDLYWTLIDYKKSLEKELVRKEKAKLEAWKQCLT